MKKKLEWKNLKDDFCPSCYAELEEKENSYYWKCLNCDFVISKTRHDEILEEMKNESDLDIVDIYK